MLKVVVPENASPWEAGLLEESTGPRYPDPQRKVSVLNTAPSLHVSAPWREASDRKGRSMEGRSWRGWGWGKEDRDWWQEGRHNRRQT